MRRPGGQAGGSCRARRSRLGAPLRHRRRDTKARRACMHARSPSPMAGTPATSPRLLLNDPPVVPTGAGRHLLRPLLHCLIAAQPLALRGSKPGSRAGTGRLGATQAADQHGPSPGVHASAGQATASARSGHKSNKRPAPRAQAPPASQGHVRQAGTPKKGKWPPARGSIQRPPPRIATASYDAPHPTQGLHPMPPTTHHPPDSPAAAAQSWCRGPPGSPASAPGSR